MTSLAESLHEFAKLMDTIEENGGEISEEVMPVLSYVELHVKNKIDSYVNFYDVVKGQIERTKNVIDSFKKTLKTLENLEQHLKGNVRQLMENHDFLKIEGNQRSIKLLNSGGTQATSKPDDMFFQLECMNPAYLIELHDFVEEKIVYVIKDKEQFKEAVKNGKFTSCYLLPRGKYVKFI